MTINELMRWLIHGTVTGAAIDALVRHEHQARAISDIDLDQGASVGEIIAAARKQQLEILTTDSDLVDAIYEQRLAFDGRLIVFLQLEGGDVEQDDAIDRLFQRYKRLSPGRLYTVTATRVKVRQLPSKT